MQITNNREVGSLSIGSSGTHEMTVDDSAVLFYLLSESLYREPLKAAAREIITNASDAHIENNVSKPIDVYLEPTQLIIHDFGGGIPHDIFFDIYGKLGKSTKVGSDNLTGGMGIGKLAPLAYTETFIVENTHKGKTTTYSISRGSDKTSGRHTIDTLMVLDKEDAQDGMRVTIPLDLSQEYLSVLCDSIKQLLYLGNINSNFTAYNGGFSHFPSLKTEGTFLVKRNNCKKSYIKYGNNIYTCNTDIGKFAPNLDKVLRTNNLSVIINIAPGTLPITPNREEYISNDQSTNTIVKALRKAENNVNHHLSNLVSNTEQYVLNEYKSLSKYIYHGYTLNSKFNAAKIDLLEALKQQNLLISGMHISAFKGLTLNNGIKKYSGHHFDVIQQSLNNRLNIGQEDQANTKYDINIRNLIKENRLATSTLKVYTRQRVNTKYRLDRHVDLLLANKIILTNTPNYNKYLEKHDHGVHDVVLFIPKRVNIDNFVKKLKKITNNEVIEQYVDSTPVVKRTVEAKPRISGVSLFDSIIDPEGKNEPIKDFTHVMGIDETNLIIKSVRCLSKSQRSHFIKTLLSILNITKEQAKKTALLDIRDLDTVNLRVNPPVRVHLYYSKRIELMGSLITNADLATVMVNIRFNNINYSTLDPVKAFSHKNSYTNMCLAYMGKKPIKITPSEGKLLKTMFIIEESLSYSHSISEYLKDVFGKSISFNNYIDSYTRNIIYTFAATPIATKVIQTIKNIEELNHV